MKAIQLIRAVILLGFGIFIRHLLIGGDISQYIHPRFEIALSLAYYFLFFLALVQIREIVTAHHHQGLNLKRELLSCVLLTLPLICAFWLPSSSLGSDMIAKKTNTPAQQVNTGTASVSSQKDSWDPLISDDKFLVTMMVLYSQPADYIKQDIEFSGFVYHQDDFPDDYFLVARYGITCCAADAQVTGLLCRFPDEQKIPNDQWVRVKGKIAIKSYQGHDMPVVEVSRLQLIEAPQNPYVC